MLGAGAAVLLVGAAAFGWHFSRIHSVVSIHLPAKPDTPSWPNEFSQRVASADEKARGWLPGVPALVELSRLYHANGFFAEAESCYRGLIKPA